MLLKKALSLKLVASHLRFDPSQSLVVAGDPRGGSTWLAEMVAGLPGVTMLWEPLDIGNVGHFRELEFTWRQYIPENARWPEARDAFERLFKGQMLNGHITLRTSARDLKRAERLLVKFCRANQLLPWLVRQFAFTCPPIYLVRHPCAVIASQMSQGGWGNVPPNFEIPNCKYDDFYRKHEPYLRSIETVEGRLAAFWCLCNVVPLHHEGGNKAWITMTYESLLLDTAGQLERIEQRWNVTFPEAVRSETTVASQTTLRSSPVAKGRQRDQLNLWRERLDNEQIQNILSVLEYFEIDLYGDGVLPTKDFD